MESTVQNSNLHLKDKNPFATFTPQSKCSNFKSLNFLETVKNMKENCGIKAFNHVNKIHKNSLVDEPQIANFVIESIRMCEKGINDISPRKDNFLEKIKAFEYQNSERKVKKKHNIEGDRRDMMKLKEWIAEKMRHQKICEKSGSSIITQRINSLNMAYSETCGFAGKFCKQMSDIFTFIHSQYHEIYQYVIECLMNQNKKIVKKNEQLQEKIQQKISHYEDYLLTLRIEYENKSTKVIQNFHKCITMKQYFEQEMKKYIKAFKQEKNKLKFFEDGLIKCLNILLEIGQQKFKAFTPEQERAILALGQNFKQSPDNYKLFHKWCISIVNMIVQINRQKQELKQKGNQSQQKAKQERNDVALATIGRFMVDSDPSLSIEDAKGILSSYSHNGQVEIPYLNEVTSEEVVKVQKKREAPNLKQLCEQLKGIDVGVQVFVSEDQEQQGIQTTTETLEAAVSAKPKARARQTCMKYWLNEKMKISKVLSVEFWCQSGQKNKAQKRLKQNDEKIKVKIPKELSRNSRRSSINNRQKKLSKELINTAAIIKKKTATKIQIKGEKREERVNEINVQNLKSTKELFLDQQTNNIDVDFLSNRKFRTSKRSKKPKDKKVIFSQIENEDTSNKKQQQEDSENNQYIINIASQKQTPQTNAKVFNGIPQHKTEIHIVDESEDAFQNNKTMKSIKDEGIGKRRRGLIMANDGQLVKKVTRGRSMKLFEGVVFSKPGVMKNKDHMIMNMIKVPQNIRFNYEKNKMIHCQEFKVQLLVKLQEKVKVLTENTMWSYKKSEDLYRLAHKIISQKQKCQIQHKNTEHLFEFFRSLVDGIILSYLKSYGQLADYESILSNPELQKQLLTGERINYYHKLAPLLFIVLNLTNPFGYRRFPMDLYAYFKGIRIMKNYDSRLQILVEVLEGTTIQFDVFNKILYYLSSSKASFFEDQFILLPVAQLQLFFILDMYLNSEEIYGLISDIRQISKKQQFGDKISLHALILKIIKTIKAKKRDLENSYRNIFEILGYESNENNKCIPYIYLIYFLELYPMEQKIKKKILLQASYFTVYWDQKEPCIPKDRLLFIFDNCHIQKNKQNSENYLFSFIKTHCENNLTDLYQRIKLNPSHAIQSLYSLFFKVPPLIYKRCQELKLGKNVSVNSVVVTAFYDRFIESQLQKIYVSGYLNALSAIPF